MRHTSSIHVDQQYDSALIGGGSMTSSALFSKPSHEIWPERFSLSQVKVEAMIGLGLCGRRLPERGPCGTRLSVPRAWT